MANTGCPICRTPIISEARPNRRFGNAQDGFMQDDDLFNQQNAPEIEANSAFNTPKSQLLKIDGEKFAIKKNPELGLINSYKQILKIKHHIEKTSRSNGPVDSGAVSFSLPCQALYDRSFENELQRLEIEHYNRKLLEMYDNPSEALQKYSSYVESLNK